MCWSVWHYRTCSRWHLWFSILHGGRNYFDWFAMLKSHMVMISLHLRYANYQMAPHFWLYYICIRRQGAVASFFLILDIRIGTWTSRYSVLDIRTFIHRGYQIIWSKGQNNENINKNQCILKQRSPGSIYTGIIKNTFGSYILKNY
jgi:hypothetical protein